MITLFPNEQFPIVLVHTEDVPKPGGKLISIIVDSERFTVGFKLNKYSVTVSASSDPLFVILLSINVLSK